MNGTARIPQPALSVLPVLPTSLCKIYTLNQVLRSKIKFEGLFTQTLLVQQNFLEGKNLTTLTNPELGSKMLVLNEKFGLDKREHLLL